MTPGELQLLTERTFVAGGEHHAEISSTNDRARELAVSGHRQLPWLIVAERQTSGRGRGENRWWTGEGSLAFSLLLDPGQRGVPTSRCGLISLVAAVAIVDATAGLVTPHLAGLHWPNDVYVGSRKLAGILVEALPDGRHIVGIGLNVNNSLSAAPPELRSKVTSLVDLSGGPHDRASVLLSILEHLELALDQLATAADGIGRRFDQLCLQRGTTLTLEYGLRKTTGLCQGVAVDGALLLATGEGLRKFYAGVLRDDRDV